MSTLLDYLENSCYDSFYEQSLNTLDILALTELSYLPFDHLITYDFDLKQSRRLDDLALAFKTHFSKGYPPLSMVTKERLTLLDLLANSKRFKHIKAFGYVNDYNLKLQKQFAAVCFRVLPDHLVTIFRGTDDTLIGWKEDFKMAYLTEIPAQRSASHYLQKLMQTLGGTYTIAGHSKGGNLAIYASSCQSSEDQKRLQAIYSFDAPGLHDKVLTSPGFEAIKNRIHSFIPQGSIVGMMLTTPKDAQIVKSKALGLLQHITFTWEITGLSFTSVEQISDDSRQIEKTIKNWTANLTPTELRDFLDLFFDTLIEAGIYRFSDITVDTLEKLQKIDLKHKQRHSEEHELMLRIIRLLLETRFQVWKESLPSLTQILADWQQSYPFHKQKNLPDSSKD